MNVGIVCTKRHEENDSVEFEQIVKKYRALSSFVPFLCKDSDMNAYGNKKDMIPQLPKQPNPLFFVIRVVHRLMGYLQGSLGRTFLIGVCVMHLLRATNIYQSNIASKYFIFFAIPIFIISKACEIYYTPENYRKYGGEGMGIGLSVPNPDPHFYSTMMSDIGFKRKIAGYVYAVSKVMFMAGSGAIIYLGVRGIFNK